MKKLLKIFIILFFTSCIQNEILVSKWCSYDLSDKKSSYFYDTIKSGISHPNYLIAQNFLVLNYNLFNVNNYIKIDSIYYLKLEVVKKIKMNNNYFEVSKFTCLFDTIRVDNVQNYFYIKNLGIFLIFKPTIQKMNYLDSSATNNTIDFKKLFEIVNSDTSFFPQPPMPSTGAHLSVVGMAKPPTGAGLAY